MQVQVEDRSVSILALGSTRVFVLELPKLYSKVHPGRFEVQTKGSRVSVKLFKAVRLTWRMLKG